MHDYMTRVDQLFGTFVFQKVLGPQAKAVLEEAVKRMQAYEEEWSFFRVGSAVSRINRLAGVAFTEVRKDTFELIRAAKQVGEQTEGLFDVTVAPLVRKWGVNTPMARVVPGQELTEALKLVDYRDIQLDGEMNMVKLKRQGQMIDLGGIAKGFIADRITEMYREYGVGSALINIGGNVKALGAKQDGEPWAIGIAYPDSHSERTIGAVSVENRSVVTSGAYERAFTSGGKLYHHILNPATGYPAETDLKSVTVVASASLDADAFSTPLFMMGLEKASAFVRMHPIEAVLITEEHHVYLTEGLRDCFTPHIPMEVKVIERS